MFSMRIEEAFETPSGTVIVCGRVEVGAVRRGDLLVVTTQSESIPVQVRDLLVFGHITTASVGDNVGIALSGIRKEAITAGSRLANA